MSRNQALLQPRNSVQAMTPHQHQLTTSPSGLRHSDGWVKTKTHLFASDDFHVSSSQKSHTTNDLTHSQSLVRSQSARWSSLRSRKPREFRVTGNSRQTSVNLNANRTRVRLSQLEQRLDAEETRELVALIERGANPKQTQAFTSGHLTLREIYEVASVGAFGQLAGQQMSLNNMRVTLQKLGHEKLFDKLVGELLPAERLRLFTGKLTPVELFLRQAELRASWRSLHIPLTYDRIQIELSRDGRLHELYEARRAMKSGDRQRLEAGEMTPVEFIRFVQSYQQLHADVVIVGAGMAGLAAAQELMLQGLNVIVLEAQDRLGGRAFTDTSLGVPLDMGACWIHSSRHNPLTRLVKQHGYTVVSDEAPSLVFGGANAPEIDGQRFASKVLQLEQALERAGEKGTSWPPTLTELHSKLDPTTTTQGTSGEQDPGRSERDEALARLAWLEIDPLQSGLDIGNPTDFANIQREGREDLFVREGLGRLTADYGYGVPMRLNTPVERIVWNDDGAQVVAVGETYHAKRVIITASVGVLESDTIAFDPPLPPWKIEAMQSFTMGQEEKVMLQFDPGVLARYSAGTRVHILPPDNTSVKPHEFVIRPFNSDTVVSLSAGAYATQLSKQSDSERISDTLDRLEGALGPDLRKSFKKGIVTHWNSPWTGGCYSALLPHGEQPPRSLSDNDVRHILGEPVGALEFAGEACELRPGDSRGSHGWPTHLTAAYLTGLEAAAHTAYMIKLQWRPVSQFVETRWKTR